MQLRIIVALFCSLAGATANAAVITSGTIEVHGLIDHEPYGKFAFAGDDFSVTGRFCCGVWSASGAFFVPGQALLLNGFIANSFTFEGGTATIGTSTFGVWWGADYYQAPAGDDQFSIEAHTLMGSVAGTYEAPFSMSGSLCGTNAGGTGVLPCVVSLPVLSGKGIVQATVVQDPLPLPNGTPIFQATDVVYTFSVDATPTVPNPEPATWVLMLIAYGAVIAYARVPSIISSSFMPEHVDRAK